MMQLLYSPRSAGSGPPGGGARTRSLRCARPPRRPCPGRRRAAGSRGAGSPSCAAAAAGCWLDTASRLRENPGSRRCCAAGLGAAHVTRPANGGARPGAGGSVHTRHQQPHISTRSRGDSHDWPTFYTFQSSFVSAFQCSSIFSRHPPSTQHLVITVSPPPPQMSRQPVTIIHRIQVLSG